jgi:hypothetical protein
VFFALNRMPSLERDSCRSVVSAWPRMLTFSPRPPIWENAALPATSPGSVNTSGTVELDPGRVSVSLKPVVKLLTRTCPCPETLTPLTPTSLTVPVALSA